jgi:hypothetical protein
MHILMQRPGLRLHFKKNLDLNANQPPVVPSGHHTNLMEGFEEDAL